MALTPPRDIKTIDAAAKLDAVAPTLGAEFPYHVAIIIDGVVQQVFHVEERLAAALLSSPQIIQCDSPDNGGPATGWVYDSTTSTFGTGSRASLL
jgi:hypothetical protein